MTKKFAALAGLILVLSVQRPQAQGARAQIYFVDIGTGAGTLIVSPTGKTLLVDGGPPGRRHDENHPDAGCAGHRDDRLHRPHPLPHRSRRRPHRDHRRRTRRRHCLRQRRRGRRHSAEPDRFHQPGVHRLQERDRRRRRRAATIAPGQVIDLGGGMRATCLVAGGRLLGGGSVPITNEDLNSEAISLLDRVQRLRLHRLGRPHRRRQHQHRESAGCRNLGRPARRRRRRRPAQPSRQHDREQSDVSQRAQSRSRGRRDRLDQHLRPSEPRNGQQVPEHAVDQRQRFPGTGAAAAGPGPGLLSDRTELRRATTANRSRAISARTIATAGSGTILLDDRRHHQLLDAELRRRRRADRPAAAHLSDRRRVERSDHRLPADRHPDDRIPSRRSPQTRSSSRRRSTTTTRRWPGSTLSYSLNGAPQPP